MPKPENKMNPEAVHQFITKEMSHVRDIISTMNSKKILAFDQYLVNFEKVAFFYGAVEPYMKNEAFINYMKKNDIETYIQVLSVGNGLVLVSNFLLNLEKFFKDKTSKNQKDVNVTF